jgi:hypothetical protein
LNRFGKASADAINAALTAVLKDLVPRIIPRIQDDNSKTVGLVNEALERGASGNNLRADLLYWKETLYSPAKKVSCRRLSPDAAATYWVAYDLHKQMTPLHPIRVEFFLRETLGAALGNNAAIEPVALEQFCCALGSELAPDGSWPPPSDDERLALLDAVYGIAEKKIETQEVARCIGIPAISRIPREELAAVLLFRELQARRLTEPS